MAYALQPDPSSNAPRSEEARAERSPEFQVSSEPVIAEQASLPDPTGHVPHSYGSESLHLLASDPQTIFAFWDLDWNAAFGGPAPAERKVHLRILNSDDVAEATVEIEPSARTCSVTVSEVNAAYSAEIGYFTATNVWSPIAVSAPVTMPSGGITEAAASTEYATIPFHLSFQRILDALPTPEQESPASLTSMLSGLRARAATGVKTLGFSLGQRELIQTIDESVAKVPAPIALPSVSLEAWSGEKLQRILGFGGASPTGGFGGSGRAS